MQLCENDLFSISYRILHLAESDLLKNSTANTENKYHDFTEQCNRLCAKYIYQYITSNLHPTGHPDLTITELKSSLSICSDYDKFFNYMLNVLISDNFLVTENNLLKFGPSQPAAWDISEIKMIYPTFKGTLTLLDHCASHLSLALSEKIPAISVLYPEGRTTFLDTTLAEDTLEFSHMPFIRNTAVNLISSLAHKQKRLKILEVGGGQGLFTRELLKAITNDSSIEYHFTDISKRFIIDMQRYALSEGLNNLTCHQFDITKPAADQGMQLNSYDIILGLDVIHATQDIEASLRNLKSLLKQDGLFCVLETTTAPRWQHIIMGLTKGWWLFNDRWRTSSPLLSSDLWENALESCGFQSIYIPKFSNGHTDSALIIASF
jgi:ubiquinone/menaquinone biosynthesis C-methylase UbiE